MSQGEGKFYTSTDGMGFNSCWDWECGQSFDCASIRNLKLFWVKKSKKLGTFQELLTEVKGRL